MPYAGRPDSWIFLSPSPGRRNRAGAASAGNEDLLSEFAPETTPQVITAPAASMRIPHSTVDRRTATRLPTRSHKSERRPLRLVASLATRARGLRARSTESIRIPSWMGRVRDLRQLTRNTALTTFAGGIATGVLVMWFVGAQPPLPVVPSTTQAVRPEPTSAPPDVPALPQDGQPAAESLRASSPARPSPFESSPRRPVGTSGRKVASSTSTPRRKAAGAPPPSYQGSLAFRSAPQGARVFVNGAFVGATPLVLENLPVGSRAVRIEADGYQRWSSSTQVVANRQTSVSATLGRADP